MACVSEKAQPARATLRFAAVIIIAVALLGSSQAAQAAAVLYVSPDGISEGLCGSWESSCSLAYALEIAAPGVEIWAVAGTYLPGDQRSDTFRIPAGIALYGGFAGGENERDQRDPKQNISTLSGNIGDPNCSDDNVFHVVTIDESGTPAIVDGFTIRDGMATGTIPDNQGAGIWLLNSTPVLNNLTITANHAVYGGGIYSENAAYTLSGSLLLQNTASSGAGIYHTGSAAPTLQKVLWNGNVASVSGGAMFNTGSAAPVISGSIIAGNQAIAAGGIFSQNNSAPVLRNVTIVGNQGGAFAIYGSQPVAEALLINVVAWSNQPNAFAISGVRPAIRSSLLEGGCPLYASCQHVYAYNPKMVRMPSTGDDTVWGTSDDDYGDLRLMPGSPAIDLGNNSGVLPGVTEDLAGHPRFIEDALAPNLGLGLTPLVDIGAYEALIIPTATEITAVLSNPSVTGQPVAVAFSVTPAQPGAGEVTGTVTVTDGITSCTAPVSAGECQLSFPTAGSRKITASYSGNPTYHPSTSAPVDHQVDRADVKVSLMFTYDPSSNGKTLLAIYTVEPAEPGSGVPTGMVQVSTGSHSCESTVEKGQCKLTLPGLGQYSIAADYSGDANFLPGSSDHITQQVTPLQTTTRILSITPSEPFTGQAVTVVFEVTAGEMVIDGPVTVTAGDAQCQATAAEGSCSLIVPSAGLLPVSASFTGSEVWLSSSSNAQLIDVQRASTSTSLQVKQPSNPQPGTPLSITFGVQVVAPGSGTPTGQVKISDGMQIWFFDTALSGVSQTIVPSGSTFTAEYLGDQDFAPSAAETVQFTTEHRIFLPIIIH